MGIIDTIIERRKADILSGVESPFVPPDRREFPLTSFGSDPFVIAEVKKQSPSKGVFADDFNHLEIASSYIEKGIKNISVITEKNYFGGSLSYLYEIKKNNPGISVLRKDFLFCENDIDISYRCGADALLLIASALEKRELEILYHKTVALGMKPLVEIHDRQDLEKVKFLKPALTGINSRNLSSFYVDRMLPLDLVDRIDWETDIVFESGIGSKPDADFAFSSGFSGILTGESVIKNRELVSLYIDSFNSSRKSARVPEKYFWRKISEYTGKRRPIVKICGITNYEDCMAAALSGADIAGMVFAPSPRKADNNLPEKLSGIDILKVAVLVNPDNNLLDLMRKHYSDGLIDAVQLSGDENGDFCSCLDIPFYKAVRVGDLSKTADNSVYHSPRILFDSFVRGSYGGTGKTIDRSVLEHLKMETGGALWIAGGIGPGNADEIIGKYSPELIDVSSSIEKSPGRKDHEKMKILLEKARGNMR